MNEQENNLENEELFEEVEVNTISSSATIRTEDEVIEAGVEPPQFLVDAGLLDEAEAEQDPIFRELAEPKLPELERENRAKLLMQTPNRLYFYWSIKSNPYQILQKAFQGNTGSYQLVAKIFNQKNEQEQIFAVEAEGNWWFNVEPNASYRAEVGFYAPNRRYIRIIFSNTIETPRKSPSPRVATDADFAVTAQEFSEVLDIAGYKQDAFEVALIGDDNEQAETATRGAFAMFTNAKTEDSSTIDADELRFALLAIASGILLKDLREHISPALFALLQSLSFDLTAEKALAALGEYFDVFADEIFEEEEFGAAVYGASLLNFPKTIKKRIVPKEILPKFGEKLSPLSSHNFQD
ncbi:MAG: DUF4912 domain-containing protein [Pyrinomonadaceae bacterium]